MKKTIIKNTVTKALILFVALITTTSLLASEITEEVVCGGQKSLTSKVGDELITNIVDEFEFHNKAFPYGKKVEIGKIESQAFYLELDSLDRGMMTLSAEDESGQGSIKDFWFASYKYYEYQSDKEKSDVLVVCVMESFNLEDFF